MKHIALTHKILNVVFILEIVLFFVLGPLSIYLLSKESAFVDGPPRIKISTGTIPLNHLKATTPQGKELLTKLNQHEAAIQEIRKKKILISEEYFVKYQTKNEIELLFSGKSTEIILFFTSYFLLFVLGVLSITWNLKALFKDFTHQKVFSQNHLDRLKVISYVLLIFPAISLLYV